MSYPQFIAQNRITRNKGLVSRKIFKKLVFKFAEFEYLCSLVSLLGELSTRLMSVSRRLKRELNLVNLRPAVLAMRFRFDCISS